MPESAGFFDASARGRLAIKGRTTVGILSMSRAQSHTFAAETQSDISSAFDAGNYVAVTLTNGGSIRWMTFFRTISRRTGSTRALILTVWLAM
jgi:hypothetical protein